jgi:dTDP-4-amino-4,6-dideoxygalactose transaminase
MPKVSAIRTNSFTSSTLHSALLLERLSAEVTYVRVDDAGLIDPDDIRGAITKNTFLISIMHANNEVGTLQPIAEIAKIRPRAWYSLADRCGSIGLQEKRDAHATIGHARGAKNRMTAAPRRLKHQIKSRLIHDWRNTANPIKS